MAAGPTPVVHERRIARQRVASFSASATQSNLVCEMSVAAVDGASGAVRAAGAAEASAVGG